jgi:hypothetical protein
VRRATLLVAAVMLLCGCAVSVHVGGPPIGLAPGLANPLAIPGAPGYTTFTGPHGKPLPVGHPWGRQCQAIVFYVVQPVFGWVNRQVEAVVGEANRDGIDVTLRNGDRGWIGPLHGGSNPVDVPIGASEQPAPALTNGQPEHITLGWDTTLDPDGRHEELTHVQGVLWEQTLHGHAKALRRAVRQLIGMTQGVGATARHDSAIAEGSTIDRFTKADLAAMQAMSGCANGSPVQNAGSNGFGTSSSWNSTPPTP